jgi:hypothetical protein
MEKNLKNNSPELKTLAVKIIDGGGLYYSISWKCDAIYRIHYIEHCRDSPGQNLITLKPTVVVKSDLILCADKYCKILVFVLEPDLKSTIRLAMMSRLLTGKKDMQYALQNPFYKIRAR